MSNHALNDMYILNYETINNLTSLYNNFIEVIMNVINSVISIYVLLINNFIFHLSVKVA